MRSSNLFTHDYDYRHSYNKIKEQKKHCVKFHLEKQYNWLLVFSPFMCNCPILMQHVMTCTVHHYMIKLDIRLTLASSYST